MEVTEREWSGLCQMEGGKSCGSYHEKIVGLRLSAFRCFWRLRGFIANIFVAKRTIDNQWTMLDVPEVTKT